MGFLLTLKCLVYETFLRCLDILKTFNWFLCHSKFRYSLRKTSFKSRKCGVNLKESYRNKQYNRHKFHQITGQREEKNMAISGIGNSCTYIYNSQTGKLSSKDGTKDAFVDYFNGDRSDETRSQLN